MHLNIFVTSCVLGIDTYMLKYCQIFVEILPEIVKNVGSSFKMERVVGPIVGGAHYRKPIIRPKIQTWLEEKEWTLILNSDYLWIQLSFTRRLASTIPFLMIQWYAQCHGYDDSRPMMSDTKFWKRTSQYLRCTLTFEEVQVYLWPSALSENKEVPFWTWMILQIMMSNAIFSLQNFF